MMDSKTEKLLEELKEKHPEWGRIKLAKAANIPPANVQRWLNKNRQKNRIDANRERTLLRLADKLSDHELELLARSMDTPPSYDVAPFKHEGKTIKIGVMSDTHIGSKFFREDWLLHSYEWWAKNNVDLIYHVGDITEGMSGRDGQIYELSLFGFDEQTIKAAELFDQAPAPIRAITGNHDLWYMGRANAGANVGQRIERLTDKFTHIGDEEADETILGNVKIKLWHGRDGAAYALSYRTQKFVEALSGGQKPHILLSGHAHKSIAFTYRNVEIVECGTLQAQTKWMRGKRLAAMTCAFILEVTADDQGLKEFTPRKIRFYE